MTKLEQLQKQYEDTLASMTAKTTENLAIARLEGKIKLVSDEQYVSAKIKRQHKAENLVYLQQLLSQINGIPEVKITGSSDSFKLRAYPVGESQFSSELATLLGIITASESAYVEEHKLAVQAILGCTMIDLEDTILAFGRTAYYSKRSHITVNQINGSYQKAKVALQDIAEAIKVPHPIDMSAFTEDRYTNFFANAYSRAKAKHEETEKALEIDSNNKFTL